MEVGLSVGGLITKQIFKNKDATTLANYVFNSEQSSLNFIFTYGVGKGQCCDSGRSWPLCDMVYTALPLFSFSRQVCEFGAQS